MRKFIHQRWFLLVLAAVLYAGIVHWQTLEPVANAKLLRKGVVAVVLFLMAFPLQAGAMWRAMRRPGAPLLGIAMNYGAVPLTAWAVSWGLRADTGAGLLVAATIPCTLASAAVWTRRAGGNDAAAILVTIFTNATCFVVTPLWLATMLGARAGKIEIDVTDMMAELGSLVVLPMVVAQLLRLVRPLGAWATRHTSSLSVVAQCGILTMVFIGAISTGRYLEQQPPSEAFSLWDWTAMIASVLGVHLAMLWGGYYLAGGLRLGREDQIAVGIAGSQKTLMVGLQIAMELGILILPMIVYHVGQLILDTVIVDRWRQMKPEPGASSTSAKEREESEPTNAPDIAGD